MVVPVDAARPPSRANPVDRLGLNTWLQVFLTIIAGAAVAVIAWTVIRRFLHIIALLIASFVLTHVLSPLVAYLQRRGVPRALAILLVYFVLFGVIILGFV